jgi:prefoldin subunit 5
MTEEEAGTDDTGFVERLHARVTGAAASTDTSPSTADESQHTSPVAVDAHDAITIDPVSSTEGRSTDGGIVTEEDVTDDQSMGAGGTVARALAAELRADAVDEATAETLRTQLGPECEPATAVRLDRLTARVNELDAYSDAIDRLAARIDELEAYTGALEDLLNRIGTDDDIAGTLEALDERVTRLETGGQEADQLRTAVQELSREMSRIETKLDSVEQWQEELSDVFSGVGSPSASAGPDRQEDNGP